MSGYATASEHETQPALPGSIAALAQAYRSGALCPADIVADCLARASAANDEDHAFVTLMGDSAMPAAQASALRFRAGSPISRLDGIPVAVKDFYDTAGVRTTAGFRHFADRVPPRDAEMVRALKAVGAIIIGKTNMDRLGQATTGLHSDFGQVRNPIWPDRAVGGSSSGSAAAIARRSCYLTIDTDAAGSARLPAACCGHVGFKPSYGLLSGDGILPEEPADPTILAFAHVGLQAASVHDLAFAVPALCDLAIAPDIAAIKVAAISNAIVDPSMRPAIDAALAALGTAAILHPPIAAPFDILAFDAAPVAAHRRAVGEILFVSADVLALPTLVVPPPKIVEIDAADDLAVRPDNVFIANYFGAPAITLPVGEDAQGLPVSLQLLARPGWDGRLLALAAVLERRLMTTS
jgi:aspartyl-tRNA(Asn)/glutamyl-tRNA(Gln) amidotransferase subunit A